MIITDKAQIKVAELKESNNLRLSGSDELECYELIESDLKLPADVTFARSSVAYLSDGTQVAANTPRFEQGRFGKAIMVEEGTENIGSPASLFDDSWTLANGASTILDTYTRKYTFTSTSFGAFAYKNFTLTVGIIYTWSAEVKGEGNTIGKQVHLQCNAENAFGTPVTLTSKWQRVTLTFTATNTARAVGFIGIPVDAFAVGDVVYIRNFQWEQKHYATSFTDGTRAAETPEVPTEGVLNPQEGTVECWVYFPPSGRWSVAGQAPTIFWAGSNSTGVSVNQIYADIVDQGTLRLVIYDSSNAYKLIQTTSAITSGWHYLAYKWDGTGPLAICVDGVKQSTTTVDMGTGVCSSVERFTLGFNGYDNARQINSLIDDLRISNRARTDAEILAAYQSGQPLLVDEWTTYKLDFDNKILDFDNKIRITTQGQIICNELIEI